MYLNSFTRIFTLTIARRRLLKNNARAFKFTKLVCTFFIKFICLIFISKTLKSFFQRKRIDTIVFDNNFILRLLLWIFYIFNFAPSINPKKYTKNKNQSTCTTAHYCCYRIFSGMLLLQVGGVTFWNLLIRKVVCWIALEVFVFIQAICTFGRALGVITATSRDTFQWGQIALISMTHYFLFSLFSKKYFIFSVE